MPASKPDIKVARPEAGCIFRHAGVTRRSHVSDHRNIMSFFIERSDENAKDNFCRFGYDHQTDNRYPDRAARI
jgi:hypothetical protein